MLRKDNLENLKSMMQDLKRCTPLYRPSNFWIKLNEDHLQEINTSGIINFKRSINLRYFNWGLRGIIAHGLYPIVNCVMDGNYSPFTKGELMNNSVLSESKKRFNRLSAYFYKTYVCALYDYISKIDKKGILNKLNEPIYGNPFIVKYRGKKTSQDLCNSVHEFSTIANVLDLSKVKNIVELGAGYGRTAYVFLKTLPSINYTIIDIPPALYISQWYFSKFFKKGEIFYYQNFKSFPQIKDSFEAAKIKFLMPNQIALIPKKYFDLAINISSLHEMRRSQIKNYLAQINRVCKGYFYSKQWRRSLTFDNSHITQKEYPIPKNWELLYSRRIHPIQLWFFDALYKIN